MGFKTYIFETEMNKGVIQVIVKELTPENVQYAIHVFETNKQDKASYIVLDKKGIEKLRDKITEALNYKEVDNDPEK